jgi:hypothetical protein
MKVSRVLRAANFPEPGWIWELMWYLGLRVQDLWEILVAYLQQQKRPFFHPGYLYSGRHLQGPGSEQRMLVAAKLVFVAVYQSRCFVLPVSCWDWTKRRKSHAWGNHHLLLVISEWSIAAGLSIVVNNSFARAVFTNVKILYLWESAWYRKSFFLEHIFKVRSFYFIYFIFLLSVNGLFGFSSLFMMTIILFEF